MTTFRAHAGEASGGRDVLLRSRSAEALRWRDIAVPVGRSPAIASRAGDAQFARPLEMLRRHLIRDGGGWTSPSAGGIYPFEFWVWDAANGALGHVDLLHRRVLTTSTRSFAGPPQLVLALRPWLSARKYGDRGLAYALLDAGHALLNMQIGASAGATTATILSLGTAAELPLPAGRFPVARLTTVLEPAGDEEGPQWWIEQLGPGGVAADVGEYEELFGGRLSGNWRIPPVELGLHRRSDVVARLARQLHHRRSTTSFGAGRLPVEDVQAVVAAAVADSRTLGWGADLPVTHSAIFSRTADSARFSMENLFHQQHLTQADHVVALSVPLPGTQEPIADEVASSILTAGMLGQCLYLEATERRLAVTGVGGFVPTSFRSGATTWPVYCMAFGRMPGQQQVKEDAMDTARAHGFGS